MSAAWKRVGMVMLVQVMGMVPCPAAEPAQTFFSIRKHDGYPQPEKTLQHLVMARGTPGTHHFCVVGYRMATGDEYAWVHWREGRALVLWEPVAEARHPAPLTASRRFLHLDRDVVDSEADIKGSSYLVTRAWARQTEVDCAKHGEKFVVAGLD